MDDWLGADDVEALRSIASRGAAAAGSSPESGGPTIVDVNSGYVMAPGGRLANIYAHPREVVSTADLELYRGIIRRLKSEVEAHFASERPLYFTAPTFIARLSGENRSWEPASPHDE